MSYAFIVKEDGNEYLVYDKIPYSIKANGLEPDIDNFGDHSSIIEDDDIVHSVYTSVPDGHPCLTLDNLTYTSSETGYFNKRLIDTGVILDDSTCKDYADGYPSSVGSFSFNYPDAEVYKSLLSGLGLTFDYSVKALRVKLISGIVDGEIGTRLNCGCPKFDVELNVNVTADGELLECYLSGDGGYEVEDLSVVGDLDLVDFFGCGDLLLDGSIPTMFEVV
jgi:hypothetical protein